MTLELAEISGRLAEVSLGAVEVTFVPADPPRQSWFAFWHADQQESGQITGLHGSPLPFLPERTVDLVLAGDSAGPTSRSVPVSALNMADAIDFFANFASTRPSSGSIRAWTAVVRSALSIVADGRVLPAVSKGGWECWHLKPLRANEQTHKTALALALPVAAHCLDLADQTTFRQGASRIMAAEEVIRLCWDGVSDRMIRTAAASQVVSSPLFSDADPIRVPHLRSWASDLSAAHSPGAGLSLRVVPPMAGLLRSDEPQPQQTTDEGEMWTLVLLLRSHLDPSLVIDANQLWRAPDEVVARFGEDAETELLLSLRRGAEICPVLAPALEQSAPSRLLLDDEMLDQLVDHVDALEEIGIDVRWPSELGASNLERRVVVDASSPSGALPTVTDLDSLLSVDWEFLLDGVPLTAEELAVLSEAKRPLVPLRGRWIRLDRNARDRLRATVPTISASDALAAALGTGLEIPGSDGGQNSADDAIPVTIRGAVKDLADRLLALDGEREEAEPPGLNATLRPYQRRGLAWMADLCSLGLGGCLADDMGLGKTVQLLALHALRGGPTLVVCPTSLLANWEREAHRFLPGTIVHRFHGSSRSLLTVEKGDLVITTYGVVRTDAAALAKVEWDLVVADEAQYAKNPRSRTAKALRLLPGQSRLALTGTPVENRLSELWSILDWTVPGLLGPLETFRHSLSIPIERDGDPEAIARLNAVVKPFLLRRKKTDPGIAPELPAKLERDVIVPLTPEQITLYQATTKEALSALAKAGTSDRTPPSVSPPSSASSDSSAKPSPQTGSVIQRQGLILKLLTALKQITNHPAQYLGETSPLAGRSGKLAALDDIVATTISQGQSTLVFTQYVSMGKLLIAHLEAQGVGVEMLHGGLSIRRRQELVDDFQAGKFPILILSLKAGGTGLNLTRASNVVHYDRWWNPAVEDQATDRAYRIGQTQTVTVHRLITEGTVEDRIGDLLAQKRQLADRVVGSGEQWIGNLNDEQLAELVSLTTVTTEIPLVDAGEFDLNRSQPQPQEVEV